MTLVTRSLVLWNCELIPSANYSSLETTNEWACPIFPQSLVQDSLPIPMWVSLSFDSPSYPLPTSWSPRSPWCSPLSDSFPPPRSSVFPKPLYYSPWWPLSFPPFPCSFSHSSLPSSWFHHASAKSTSLVASWYCRSSVLQWTWMHALCPLVLAAIGYHSCSCSAGVHAERGWLLKWPIIISWVIEMKCWSFVVFAGSRIWLGGKGA